MLQVSRHVLDTGAYCTHDGCVDPPLVSLVGGGGNAGYPIDYSDYCISACVLSIFFFDKDLTEFL